MSIDPNSILMGGGVASAKFETVGTTVTGTIEDLSASQQTDFQTGELKTWPNGDPMMQVVVTLATDQRDPSVTDDDGLRKVYVKGKSLTAAVRDAVRRAGAKGLEPGGTLTVTYTGDGPQERRGINPPKLYTAAYAKPDPAAAANAALGLVQAEPPTTPPTTPAPAPAPAPLAAVPAATGETPAVDPKLAAALAAMTPEQKAALGIPA